VTGRPYVVLSCAMSVDGYIDNTGPDRLVLSSAEDLERVDALRASCDAILVGAGTVRRDDPRLLVRSAARREERVARGATPDPIKATVTVPVAKPYGAPPAGGLLTSV
jgi:5-amino-6-(5-phosphoribosylamino)uracil reductase